MFISNKPELGDKVVLLGDAEVMAGTFTKGHEFKIINFGERGWDLEDADGNRLLETCLIHDKLKLIKGD